MEGRNGSLGERDDDDDDDDDERCNTCVQNWRVKLIFNYFFEAPIGCSEPGLLECLKIIDVGCNLKQFDVEAERKCIFHFRP